MSGLGVTLRELHRLHRFARELQDQIDRQPKLIQAQHARVAHQEKVLHEAQEALKKLKLANLEKESQLKAKHQLIAKHSKHLDETASNKEYTVLKEEIANARRACAEIEEQILAAMLEIEEKAAQLPDLEKAVQQARQECAAFEQTSNARKADLEQQLAQARRQLAELEPTLPEAVVEQYNRLVARFQSDALTAAKDRTCVACYTAVTAQMYNDLLANRLVLCKACGRILYLPE